MNDQEVLCFPNIVVDSEILLYIMDVDYMVKLKKRLYDYHSN